MKRRYSKATLYRKVKRGITICEDLSQDYHCYLDCCKISESHAQTNADDKM